MTFAILTDSTADLDQNWAKEHQVTILGLTIELRWDSLPDNEAKVN